MRKTSERWDDSKGCASRTKDRLHVVVGETWSRDDVSIEICAADAAWYRVKIITGLTLLFGGVLVALMVYAIVKQDQVVMRRVLDVTTVGLTAIGAWAVGSSVARKVRDQL